MNLESKFFRPKTINELTDALRKNQPCEVVASMTSLILEGWASDIEFNTRPSENIGWVIYESANQNSNTKTA